MTTTEETAKWNELMRLLEPFHDEARLLARGIARSRSEGDDLFQEATLRALDKLPSLRDHRKFRGWFYKVLLSVHRSLHRRRFWKRFTALELANTSVGDDGATWEDSRTSARRAASALSTLSSMQREAIVLFEIQGFSLDEVGSFQGVSVSTVKSRLARGRIRLRKFYSRLENGPARSVARKEECDESFEASL